MNFYFIKSKGCADYWRSYIGTAVQVTFGSNDKAWASIAYHRKKDALRAISLQSYPEFYEVIKARTKECNG